MIKAKRNRLIFLMLLTGVLSMLFALAGLSPVVAATDGANNDIKAGTVTLVDDTTNLFVPLYPGADEDYNPSSRKWNGISSVITAGDNMFTAWYTGGDKEGPHNYIVVAASTDGGATWIDPLIIIDNDDEVRDVGLPIFLYNNAGELLLYYSQSNPGSSRTVDYIKILNADGPLSQLSFTEPSTACTGMMYQTPTLLSDGRIMFASSDSVSDTIVWVSEDDGYTYTRYSEIEHQSDNPQYAAKKVYSISPIVEFDDGRLWMLSRIEGGYAGGLEQSFSLDGGKTWEIFEANLPDPLKGPGARMVFMRLNSGALLFVSNEHSMEGFRRNLTAYLSYDEGLTWPHSILLDTEDWSTYPNAYQDDEGVIYISFDRARYRGENGIRVSILTEADIVAGKFISQAARNKLIVTKQDHSYADITSVNNSFKRTAVYAVGTSLTTIVKDFPTKFKVTDSNGEVREVSGQWRCPGFDSSKPGVWRMYLGNTDLPRTLIDSYDMLSVEISIEKEGKKGCSSGIGGTALLLSAFSLSLCAVFVCRAKQVNKKEKVK